MRFPVLAVCCLLASASPGAQQPLPIDAALVAQAMTAATEEARAALFAAHPELAGEPGRRALTTGALQKGKEGDVASAYNALRTLLLVATRTDDTRGRIVALNAIGFLAGQGGDFVLAEPTLIEARDLAATTGDADIFIGASNNLGIVQRLQGKYDDAIASYQRTLAVAEQAGRRDSVARSLNNLGVVAQQQGDYRAALDYLTRSLAIKEELKQTLELISTSLNIGILHQQQRNLPLALDYYEQSRARAAAANERRALTSALTSIGEVHALEGRYTAAREALGQALTLAETEGDPLRTATVWQNLGAVARRQGRWAESQAAFERSLAMQEAANDNPGASDSLAGLAELALARGEHERALTFAERGAALARGIGRPDSQWRALSTAGSAHAALGRGDQAVTSLQESIDVVERIRQRVAGGAQDLQRFFDDKSAPYYELAAVHAAAGRPAEAFAAVERARARVLLDLLAGGQPIVRALSDDERTRERQLDRELLALNVQSEAAARQTPPQPERRNELDAALARARRAKDDWQSQAYTAHPDLRFGRGEAPIVSLADAAAVVPAGTAIAMFLSDADRTRLLLLTRTAAQATPALQMFTVPVSRDNLARHAQAFSQQISQRDLAFAPSARALYDILLGAADRQLATATRLIVVPDGSLWDVPFQALMTPRGRFLIEERAVSYTPSVSALYRLHARRSTRTGGARRLVALGDPSTSGTAARLPEAAREVRALAAMYGDTSGVFVGADATEARLRDAAPAASVLHVATHGELTRANPMYSFVMLGGSGGDELAQDGRVEAWEIANMTLQANLVVLSACETARGGSGGGEGVVGLAWSLFAAGASTAAVSLWRVDSASTTELMLGFHRALLRRAPATPADAMRDAARALLASSQYRHPFYWAGFVVVGTP